MLFIIIALMAGLTWLVPSGQYSRKDDTIIPGSYQKIDNKATDVPQLDKGVSGMPAKNDDAGKEDKGARVYEIFLPSQSMEWSRSLM